MSPIGSYVGGLTSKGQVGVLLGEHRGWILRMAFSYKAKTFRTTAFFPLCSNIQHSTFHQADCGGSLQTIRWFRRSARKPVGLPFRLKGLRTFACFPVSPQRGINYPPSASADGPPFLSRKELRFASFPLVSFCILAFS